MSDQQTHQPTEAAPQTDRPPRLLRTAPTSMAGFASGMGNAAFAALVQSGSPRMVSRDGATEAPPGDRQGRTQVTPGSSSQSKQPTPAQVATLKGLQGSMNGLSGKAQVVSEQMRAGITSATSQLDAVDAQLAVITKNYETAHQRHVKALTTAGAEVARDEALMKMVLGIALGIVVGQLVPATTSAAQFEELVAQVNEKYATCWEEKQVIEKLMETGKGATESATEKGVDAGVGESGGKATPNPTADPKLKQIQAISEVSALKTKVLKAAGSVLNLAPLDKEIESLLRDIAVYAEKGSGTSVSDPVEVVIRRSQKMTQNAPAAYAAAEKATAAASKATGSLGSQMAQAAAAATVDQLEDKIWVAWIAGVSDEGKKKILAKLNGGLIDGRLLPQHVIDMLGVDTGAFASDSDLNQQVANAGQLQRAQQLIGKTGTYTGPMNPNSKGTAIVDGSDFPAEFAGFVDQQRNSPEEGTRDVLVIDARVFPTQAAGTGTGMNKARERFGLSVRPLEPAGDPNAPKNF